MTNIVGRTMWADKSLTIWHPISTMWKRVWSTWSHKICILVSVKHFNPTNVCVMTFTETDLSQTSNSSRSWTQEAVNMADPCWRLLQSFQFEFTFFSFCFLSSQTSEFIIVNFHCSKEACQQLSEMAYCSLLKQSVPSLSSCFNWAVIFYRLLWNRKAFVYYLVQLMWNVSNMSPRSNHWIEVLCKKLDMHYHPSRNWP